MNSQMPADNPGNFLSEKLLLNIIDSVSNPIFIKNRQHRLVFFNDAFCQFTGYNRVEIIGKSDYDFFSPEQADIFWEKDELIFTSGVSIEDEEYFTDLQGEVYILSIKKFLFKDASGNQFLVGIFKEITEITESDNQISKSKKLNNFAKSLSKVTAQREVVECKQIKENLRQKEDLLRTIDDAVNLGIVVYDVTEDNKFVYFEINQTKELTYKLKNQQIIGKTPQEIFGDDLGGEIEQRNLDCLLTGNSIYFEEIVNFEDGDNFFLTTLTPLRDGQGRIYRIISTSIDITTQKQAEATLRAKDKLFKNFSANVPGMLFQLQLYPNGSISFPYISSGCYEILGLQPEQIQADANLSISMVHPDDFTSLKTSWKKSARTLKPWQYEGRIVLSSGEIKWIKSISRPEKLDNGIIVWHGLIVDITRRKQTENAFLRSNAMLQAQQEAAIDGILVVDENHKILSCNQRFVELWEIPQSVIDSGDEAKFIESIVSKFTNLGVFIDEVENLSNDVEKSIRDEIDLGDGRCFERYCAPVKSLIGEYYGRIWYFRDITKRKQVEAKLRQQTQELEKTLLQLQRTQVQLIQSEKMSSLGQLVAGIAHEINNPVNFISANLIYAQEYFEELLKLINAYEKNYPLNPEIAELIQDIEFDYLVEDLPNMINSMQTGAERIKQIVLSLRTFSRLDEAELKKIDIHESLDSTLMILYGSLESQPYRAGIKVIKEYGKLPLVECYAGKLNQVFLNILNNAIDALEESIKNNQILEPEAARIIISTQLVGENFVQININDNASGIPEQNISKLFNPFFTTKAVGKGTGLGLSMSYQIIVEEHQGELNCISIFGKGTEFQIKIPISCNNF